MNKQNLFFDMRHSKIVKIISIIVLSFFIWTGTVEPVMAALEGLEQIEEQRRQMELERSERMLRRALHYLQEHNKLRKRFSLKTRTHPFGRQPYSPNSNMLPNLPILPMTELSSTTMLQPGSLHSLNSFLLPQNSSVAPDPLTQLPPHIKKNLSDDFSLPPQKANSSSLTQIETPQDSLGEPDVGETTQESQSIQSETMKDEKPLSTGQTTEIIPQDKAYTLFAQNTETEFASDYVLLAQASCTDSHPIGHWSSRQQLFIQAYNRQGGQERLGCTINGTYWWGETVAQDFRYSTYIGDAIIIHDEPRDIPEYSVPAYVVFGGIWGTYRDMGGPGSWLGVPTSDEFYSSSSNVYRQSNFANGYISYNLNTHSSSVYAWPAKDNSTWRAEYHNGFNLNAKPTYVRNESGINYNWGTDAPGGRCYLNENCWGLWTDHFSARWTKQQYFPAGRYTFIASSDDGVRVWLDGAMIIDGWYDHGTMEFRKTMELTGGNHDLKVEYYEETGEANIKFWWEDVQPLTLSVDKVGSGRGLVSGPGISCGSDCSEIFDEGTVVTLTATPNDDSTFDGWEGPCSGTDTCTLTITAAETVTARFTSKLPNPYPDEKRMNLLRLGPQRVCRFGGDPVNIQTGNHLQQFTDFSVLGVGDLDFGLIRTNNSLDDRDGAFGFGWSSLLDMSLRRANDDSIDVRYPDGHGVYFLFDGESYIAGQASNLDTLTWDGNNFILMTPDQISYIFDEEGNLHTVKNRHDNTITLHRNSEGQITHITDTVGREFRFSYNGTHVSSASDPIGRTISYTYSVDGDLLSVTDANGGMRRFEYENHQITRIIDPEGMEYLRNVYDSEGRVIEQIDASGNHSYFNYDTEGQTTSTDNLGEETLDSSDELFRRTETQDPLGNTEQFTYDAQDNLVEYTDKNGNIWKYTYDERGNMTSVTAPDGGTTTFTYNATNDLTSMTDAIGRVTTYTWDNGNLTQIDQPCCSTTKITYNPNGQPLTITDANGNVTQYSYDTHGNLAAVIDPLNNTTIYEYDAVGREISMTDANGHSVQFEYDGNDNMTRIIYPDGQNVTFEYDKNDNLVRMTDRRGGVTTYQYDENFKLIAETDPEGNSTTYEYDQLYRLMKETDPNGNSTLYRYDAASQLVEIEGALGGITRFEHDPNGNIVTMIDPLEQRTTFEYDSLNQLIQEIDAMGGATIYTYDAIGQLIEIAQPNGAKTRYTYDPAGQVTEMQDALGHVWQMTYDAVGNMISFTDPDGNSATFQYDEAGNLIESTSPSGAVTRVEYDGVGNTTAEIDALDRITRYVYDENDNPVTVIDPQNNITTLEYDAEDNLIAITGPNGYTIRFEYNLVGSLVTLIEPGGQTTRFEYDGLQNLVKQSNAKGNAWIFAYDALNRLASETDPAGGITTYHYDSLDQLIRLTDPMNNTTHYEYDARGCMTKETYPAGNVWEFACDSVGNTISQTDPRGATTVFTYDLLDRLTNIRDALGGETSISYDVFDNVTALIDANSHRLSFSYDEEGRLIEQEDAAGSITRFEYDRLGNMTALIDALDRITRYAYDAGDNLVAITDALGGTTRLVYDKEGNVTAVTDANGHTTQFAYDADGRLIAETEPGGATTNYEYNAVHNLVKSINAKGNAWTYTYDALDRLVSEADPLGNTTTYTYDILGRLVQMADANGIKTGYGYDVLGNLTSVLQPTGALITYNYDEVGNLTAVTDANENTTTFSYDLLQHMIQEVNPLGKIWQYEYDKVGNLTKQVANGKVTQYTYNANDLLTAVDYPDSPDVSFEYDAVSNQISMTDALGTTRHEYDDLDRLISSINHAGKQIRHTYDAVGNRTSLIYPDGQVVRYEYDQNDEVQRILDPDGNAFTIIRDTTHNPTRISHPNGTAIEYEWDDVERLVGVCNVQGDAVISAFQYTLDSVGNRIRAEEEYSWRNPRQLTHNYTYDSLYRLIRSEDSEGNFTEYIFDAVGNRTGINTNIPRPQNEQPTTEYSYGADNRLTGVKNFVDPGDGTLQLRDEIRLVYDGYGRLAQRIYNQDGAQTQIDYAYDGLDTITEYLDSGHVNYYRGTTGILGMMEQESPEQGQPYYYHYDGLGSVSAMTDQQGQLAHNYQYGDYGTILNSNDEPADPSSFSTPHNHYTYTGQEWDPYTGLYHFYAREYDPEVGYWLQQDMYRGNIEEPQTLHRYGYVAGNPISYIDRYGYLSWKSIGGKLKTGWEKVKSWASNNKGKLIGGAIGISLGGLSGAWIGSKIGSSLQRMRAIKVQKWKIQKKQTQGTLWGQKTKEAVGRVQENAKQTLLKKFNKGNGRYMCNVDVNNAMMEKLLNIGGYSTSKNKAQVESYMRLVITESIKYGLNTDQVAYIFATAHHESYWGDEFISPKWGRLIEHRSDSSCVNLYWNDIGRRKALGNLSSQDAINYKGRGFVQITGRRNYKYFKDLYGIDLINHPEKVQEDRSLAIKIMVHGMAYGKFTGASLSQFNRGENGFDFDNARRVVNGMDKANVFAITARKYAQILGG